MKTIALTLALLLITPKVQAKNGQLAFWSTAIGVSVGVWLFCFKIKEWE